MNAEFDGVLPTIKKFVVFDEVGVVKVLLLYVTVPKFGKILFDVAAGISVVGLPKVKVDVAVLGVEDTIFSKDFVFVTASATGTAFI